LTVHLELQSPLPFPLPLCLSCPGNSPQREFFSFPCLRFDPGPFGDNGGIHADRIFLLPCCGCSEFDRRRVLDPFFKVPRACPFFPPKPVTPVPPSRSAPFLRVSPTVVFGFFHLRLALQGFLLDLFHPFRGRKYLVPLFFFSGPSFSLRSQIPAPVWIHFSTFSFCFRPPPASCVTLCGANLHSSYNAELPPLMKGTMSPFLDRV